MKCVTVSILPNNKHFFHFHSFDYGEKFWIHKSKSFTCQCGTQSCRFSEKMIKTTIDDYVNERKIDLPDNS